MKFLKHNDTLCDSWFHETILQVFKIHELPNLAFNNSQYIHCDQHKYRTYNHKRHFIYVIIMVHNIEHLYLNLKGIMCYMYILNMTCSKKDKLEAFFNHKWTYFHLKHFKFDYTSHGRTLHWWFKTCKILLTFEDFKILTSSFHLCHLKGPAPQLKCYQL